MDRELKTTAAVRPGFRAPDWPWILCATLILFYLALSAIVRPTMFFDPGWGFLTWRSFLNHGALNYLVSPDPADLRRDASSFLTTWSPGQYLVPGALGLIFKNLGLGIVATVTVCSAAGLVGYYRLFRRFGFEARAAALSCVVIAAGRFFALPFGEYTGGETIIFGVGPWAILGLYAQRQHLVRFLLVLAVSLIVCTLAKLTGLIIVLSVLAGVLAVCLFEESLPRLVRRGIGIALVCGAFAILFYLFWLSRGWTAASGASGGLNLTRLTTHVAPSAAAIVFSSFSIGDLINRVFLFPGRPLISQAGTAYIFLTPLAAALLWSVWRTLYGSQRAYVVFSFVTSAVFFCVMALLYLRDAPLDLDDRHFRIVSLLLLPGILLTAWSWRGRAFAVVRVGFLVLVMAYGLTSTIPRFKANNTYPLSTAGFRHAIIDAPALTALRHKSAELSACPGAIVYLPSPEIAWDVPLKVRVMVAHVDFQTIEQISSQTYHARPAAILVALQDHVVALGKGKAILNSFVDIEPSEWSETRAGSFHFYRFTNAPAPCLGHR